MVAPHELKNKEFTKAVRGYSMAEVDDHIDFIIAQYTELYRQNADLEQRLMSMQEYISEMEGKEAEINSALVDAQKAASRTLSEANEQAETVMLATKTNCDKVMAQFRNDIEEERAKLNSLRAAVREFKAAMFETYRTHIEFLEQIAPGEIEDDTEDYTRKVIGLIKEDIANNESVQNESADEYEAAPENEAAEEAVPQEDVMTEAAEEPIPEAVPADTYAQLEAPSQEPEAPVQYEQPVQYDEPVQYEQPAQYDEPVQEQPEAPQTYEEVHSISYEQPQVAAQQYAEPSQQYTEPPQQYTEPQYAQPAQPQYAEPQQYAAPVEQQATQAQFAGIPVSDDEEDVFEEDAFDDLPPQTQAPQGQPQYAAQNEQPQYYDNAPAFEPEPDEPQQSYQQDQIYSRQSRPVSRVQNRAGAMPQRPIPQRPQMQRTMQQQMNAQPMQNAQPVNSQPVNSQPMQQAQQTNLGEQRSQVAPPQGRTRTNRASVKDAIRQLNQTFVTEDDDDDDNELMAQPQGRMNAQQPTNGQMRTRR